MLSSMLGSMILKSMPPAPDAAGDRFSFATNADRVRAEIMLKQ
jgi:hypothetical protein